MHRSTEDRSPARIGQTGRRKPSAVHGLRRWAPAVLFGTVVLGTLCWFLLPQTARPGGPGALLALLTLGGWGLGLLPVHSDRRNQGPARRLAAQPQPARGGVEPAGLQRGAEH